MKRETHTIDATGKVLGRLAVQIALLLRGKDKTGFAPYKDEGDFVVIKNVDKIKFTGKKMGQKQYFHHRFQQYHQLSQQWYTNFHKNLCQR